MAQKVLLIGSTGSIGTQALDVIEKLPGLFEVEGLAAGGNADLLMAQVHKHRPKRVAMANVAAAEKLRTQVDIQVFAGEDGVCELCRQSTADIALISIVGMAALLPTLICIEKGMRILLASKEVLVAGGELVLAHMAARLDKTIYPVDSEHSAIFQCLQGSSNAVNRLILTASGGPFYGKTCAEMEAIRPQDALAHPNWNMGAKITVDSATLMNKGLEIIEAQRLFQLEASQLEVLVHRESIIHSMVEFQDFSVLAQLGLPDMRLPIQYALTYPERLPSPVPQLRLEQMGKLTFFSVDHDAFPCLGLAYRAMEMGRGQTVVLNAANEVAVEAFLKEEIGFLDIPRIVEYAMGAMPAIDPMNVDDILQMDHETRRITAEAASRRKA